MKCLVCNKSVKQGLRLVKGEKTIGFRNEDTKGE